MAIVNLQPQPDDDELYAALLKLALADALTHEKQYAARYQDVLNALALAVRCGIPAGIRLDPDEPEWPVAVIELPTGQVSWHLPQHPTPWDGHTTRQKRARVRAYVGTTRRLHV